MEKKKLLKILIWGLTIIGITLVIEAALNIDGYKEAQNFYMDIEEDDIDFENAVAWIRLEGTVIDYPIMKSSDNYEYLNMLPNGEYNPSGSIFIDCRCDKPFEGFNTVIHGHHMKDGSMFCSLKEYEDQEYYEKHKTIEIITENNKYDLAVVASFVTSIDDMVYDMTEADKGKFIEHLSDESQIRSDIFIGTDDKLATLSTCAYDYENARRIVIGKLIKTA